jgi:hypothetical protein
MLQYVGPGSLHNYFQIWDEAGNMIFSRDSARIYETYGVGIENILSNGITNTDAGTVMMVLLNEQLSNRRLEIYKLPGYYECSVCAYYHLKLMPLTVPDEELRHVNSVKAFPNPSNDKIAVEYNLPAQNQSGTMAIYDMNGQRIRLYKLSPKSNSITIDIQGLKAGNYLCVVESGGQQVSGRIIKVE